MRRRNTPQTRASPLACPHNTHVPISAPIGPLTPVFIENDTAQYYFEQTIEGEVFLFPVEFVKENGTWKVLEF